LTNDAAARNSASARHIGAFLRAAQRFVHGFPQAHRDDGAHFIVFALHARQQDLAHERVGVEALDHRKQRALGLVHDEPLIQRRLVQQGVHQAGRHGPRTVHLPLARVLQELERGVAVGAEHVRAADERGLAQAAPQRVHVRAQAHNDRVQNAQQHVGVVKREAARDEQAAAHHGPHVRVELRQQRRRLHLGVRQRLQALRLDVKLVHVHLLGLGSRGEDGRRLRRRHGGARNREREDGGRGEARLGSVAGPV
jgi:hypothetical protein